MRYAIEKIWSKGLTDIEDKLMARLEKRRCRGGDMGGTNNWV